MNNILKIKVPGKPEFIDVCRSGAIAAAAVTGFNIETVDDIGMAVYEACKIVTCHMTDCWCTFYEMEICHDEDRFIITITSSGEYSVEKCRRICLDCPHEGDLGVNIMKSIMDDVEIHRNIGDSGKGKKIILVKNLC